MNIKELEIPYAGQRSRRYRFFEMLPGLLSWGILLLPFILSIFSPALGIWFIITYLLLWFIKSMGLSIRALQGYRLIQQHKKLDWLKLLKELEKGNIGDDYINRPKWHPLNVARLQAEPTPVKPSEIIHVALVATLRESREILEPTIQSIIDSRYDKKKIILILAYEERGGQEVAKQALELVEQYKDHFFYALAIKHPQDTPGETVGKGGNITYAGRILQKYLETQNINPLRVIVTTLDADNHPHPYYFAALSYTYCLCPEPKYVSFQPIAMFTNNIWDAPAPMRVVATGNTFWNVTLSLRPHMLRNFSSHAQSMQTLIDTDFWSVRTIVEDGHQFWRTYFRYDGRHEAYPIYLPIYQDVVFSTKYLKTLKAQFIQIRRWAYGASDIAYVATNGFFKKNKISKRDVTFKFFRLLDSHVAWAVAPLILAFSAFIPQLFNPNSYAANQLPIIASRIETIALVGIFATLFISLKTLPPKPKRYKNHRTFFMIIQWFYLPITTILYNSFAALYSQTRLLFGKYLDVFDFTEKAAFTSEDKKVS